MDELDLSVGDTYLRMGVRAVDPAQWLVRDELADAELTLKRRLVMEQRDEVLACLPTAEDAARETHDLVHDRLGAHGIGARSDDAHPLARAGLSVQEDLCLMVRRGGAWHLDGALVCFPSQWSLTEKLGHPTSIVHGPVHHYADELSAKVDTFLDRLPTGRIATRRNLSLWPACLLWVPTHGIDPALWDGSPPAGTPRLWLRSERQTLRRLPRSGAVLFTIRVQMAALAVLADRPERAGALASWLRGPAGESRRDQLGDLLGGDLEWLDRTAQQGA